MGLPRGGGTKGAGVCRLSRKIVNAGEMATAVAIRTRRARHRGNVIPATDAPRAPRLSWPLHVEESTRTQAIPADAVEGPPFPAGRQRNVLPAAAAQGRTGPPARPGAERRPPAHRAG